MFDYDTPKAKDPVDYSGLIIALILAPVFLLITILTNPDIGLSACIVLAMIVIAVKLRWNLRKHVWFWAIIVVILALHIPLVLMVRWPQQGVPTLFYTLPIGISDFLVVSGALRLAESLLLKDSPSNEDNK